MPRLAQIQDILISHKTIYINPLNVVAVEEVSGGNTQIVMVDQKIYQTKMREAEVVAAIQQAMM